MKTALRLLLVASVLYGTGAHWAALQGAAWASMLAQGKTDPCDMCRMVERGQSVATPKLLRTVPSVEFAAPTRPAAVVSTPSARLLLPSLAAAFDGRFGSPPVPPPKPSLA